MKKTRFAFFGAGFWAHFQMSAWQEISGVDCVAIYNRTLSKGKAFAEKFGVKHVYDDPKELLQKEKVDFIDLCINPSTLPDMVELAANHKTHVITQKPIAPSIAIAERLVKICQTAGNLYLVHENWRWQRQIRELKKLLCSNIVGKVFRAKLTMVSGYPVFRNEPTLKELEQFIITDIGTHIIDVARFLFGEAVSLYCQIQKVHPNIKGEDVATIMMKMRENSSTVIIELGYPENYLENDAFPQTFAFIEGEKGSIELTYDYRLKITTKEGTLSRRYPPETYPWADPDYMVVHSSIVPCNKHLLDAVRGEARAETSAEDHLNTIRLTYEAYKSANKNQAINYQ